MTTQRFVALMAAIVSAYFREHTYALESMYNSFKMVAVRIGAKINHDRIHAVFDVTKGQS